MGGYPRYPGEPPPDDDPRRPPKPKPPAPRGGVDGKARRGVENLKKSLKEKA
jgi:hypothetical protein